MKKNDNPNKPFRVKTWKQLEEVSKVIYIGEEKHLLVPMNVHGLKGKILLSTEDELILEDEKYKESLNSKKNSIFLIGVGY